MSSGQPLWILGELFRQHLNGHFTAQVGIFGPVDFSHASLAYLLKDFVVGEGGSNQ